jgi:hypothetical protein
VSVVGTLTVDLVANTATFTADLNAAGNNLEELGKQGKKAGENLDFAMTEAKGSMMLLGDEIGVHIPRHLQTLIAAIPGVGLAFAEMLPLVGVIAAIAIIEKLIAKNAEAKEKLAQGWDKFGVVSQGVFNELGDKMLEVGMKADELAGRHLAALQKELTLIDHASLRELKTEFDRLKEAGESLMLEMKSSWYEIRMGSQGASNALTHFTGEYEILLAKGDKVGAFNKLVGTLDQANARLKQMEGFANTIYAPSEKMVDAQRLLVGVLEDQLKVTKEVAEVNSGEKGNARAESAKKEEADLDERNDAVKEFCDKALKAEQEYQKAREKVRAEGAKLMTEIGYAENKAVEEAWKQHLKTEEELEKEGLQSSLTLARIQGQTEEEAARHTLAMKQGTIAEGIAMAVKGSKDRLEVEVHALDLEHDQLAAAENKDLVALKQNEDKKTALIRQATNEQTKIYDQALEKQRADTMRVGDEVAGSISKTLTQGILESKNMGLAFKKMGAEMLESAMETAMKMVLLNKMGKLSDAEAAASAAYKAGIKAYPSPENMIIAPIQAAAAFAGAMQFEVGGEVPGDGAVPIMAHGGETVVTKALTDQVKNNTGGGGGAHTMHYAPTIHAVDGDGVKRMLDKHSAVFHAEIRSTLRKHNGR